MEKAIWVLGSKHPNAHKSISWGSSFPNFANCDILIVNLQSLGKEQFRKRETELFNEAQRYVFDLIMTGEKEDIFGWERYGDTAFHLIFEYMFGSVD